MHDEHVIAVTGHRPDRLPGGYAVDSDERRELRWRITRALDGLRSAFAGPVRGRTGMALGADQDFALACIELDIPYDAVLPFDGFSDRWDAENKARVGWLLEHPLARAITLYPAPYARWKLLARNESVISPADVVVAVWNGAQDGGTAHAVRIAVSQQKRLWRVPPDIVGDIGDWIT